MRVGIAISLTFGRKSMHIADLLDDDHFTQFEERLSEQFGLERFVGDSIVRDLLQKEIEDSRFNLEQLAIYFARRTEHFDRFAREWYRDASGTDYGEEFDPVEGDQQDRRTGREVIGISEGFTISYLLLFLYGTEYPRELEGWIRTRRIPAASHVARDVRRVIRETAKIAEQGGDCDAPPRSSMRRQSTGN
ncbi:hypothetical protein [Haloferula helveola]